MDEALEKSNSLIEEMRTCLEGYRGCMESGDINKEVWRLRKWVTRAMWHLCGVKDKVEGLKREVMEKMVEVNLLLSLTQYVIDFRCFTRSVFSSSTLRQNEEDLYPDIVDTQSTHKLPVSLIRSPNSADEHSKGLFLHLGHQSFIVPDLIYRFLDTMPSTLKDILGSSEHNAPENVLPSYLEALEDGASPPGTKTIGCMDCSTPSPSRTRNDQPPPFYGRAIAALTNHATSTKSGISERSLSSTADEITVFISSSISALFPGQLCLLRQHNGSGSDDTSTAQTPARNDSFMSGSNGTGEVVALFVWIVHLLNLHQRTGTTLTVHDISPISIADTPLSLEKFRIHVKLATINSKGCTERFHSSQPTYLPVRPPPVLTVKGRAAEFV